MTARDLLAWLPTIVAAMIAAGIFAGREWLKASITRRVQHHFDDKLERLRADFRTSEAHLQSELRGKEGEISAFRDGMLSGRAQRQANVHARRLQAAETLWKRVSTTLAPYKGITSMFSVLNMQNVEKHLPTAPQLRSLFEMAIKPVPENDAVVNSVSVEQLFVSAPAWAMFNAYQTILFFAFTRAKVLAIGLEDTDIFDLANVRAVLKAALPHQANYIDSKPAEAFHFLLAELEERILVELKATLDGRDADNSEIERTAEILKAATAKLAKEIDNRAAVAAAPVAAGQQP